MGRTLSCYKGPDDLEIDATGTVKDLIARIEDHLRSNPDLSGKQGKTSADKDAEDAVQSVTAAASMTGAGKALLDNKITSNPPAQFSTLANFAYVPNKGE
ncbi:hypothetical protein H0H93_005683 [Arthromyces matolae]|nr:hypothetical protein H0H93_005683 [Arthromyces matolae]